MPIWNTITNSFQNFVGQFQPQNTISVENPQSGSSSGDDSATGDGGSGGGQGVSSAFSDVAVGPQVSAGQYSSLYGGGSDGGSGGGSDGGSSAAPEISGELISNESLDPNTVFIDGQGYSVAPENQAEFILTAGQVYGGSGGQDVNAPSYESPNISGGNLLTDTGLGYSGIAQPGDITQTYIPGIDYAQQQMAQQTQSTQMPQSYQVQNDIEPQYQSSIIDVAPQVFGGGIRRGGQATAVLAGNVLEFGGQGLQTGSDIFITSERTAMNYANQLTDKDLQIRAQKYIDDYNQTQQSFDNTKFSETKLNTYSKKANDILLISYMKGLLKIQNKRNTGVNANIVSTQNKLNEIIIEQNKLLENNIDKDGYYTGDNWSKVESNMNKITKLEEKLKQYKDKLPNYTNAPKPDAFRNVVGLSTNMLGQSLEFGGQALKKVDVTKINAENFGGGIQTALSAPAYFGAGLGEGLTGKTIRPKLNENRSPNMFDDLIYESGKAVPTEIENVGLVFQPKAWYEQPERVASGLVTTAFLAQPAYKLVRGGTSALVKFTLEKNTILAKIKGTPLTRGIVKLETQFGKGGVAREVGDIIVDQRINTIKNTFSSKTYELVKSGDKIIKKTIKTIKDRKIEPNNELLISLRKQTQTNPTKIKIDDKLASRLLVNEQGIGGVINTQVRRIAKIKTGAETTRVRMLTTGVGQKSKIIKISGPAQRTKLKSKISNKIDKDIISEIEVDYSGRRTIQTGTFGSDTIKEGALSRNKILAQIRKEQGINIGKKTSTATYEQKIIYNKAGQPIGLKTYKKPAPLVKEKINKLTDLNLGGIDDSNRLSMLTTDIRTRTGGPMRFKYSPLEVAEGTIKRSGKGTGRWGKKGQLSSYADEANDFIPDFNMDGLQSPLLGNVKSGSSVNVALTTIKRPNTRLISEALSDISHGKQLYLQNTRIKLPQFQNRIRNLAAMKQDTKTLQASEQSLLQQQIVRQRIIHQPIQQEIQKAATTQRFKSAQTQKQITPVITEELVPLKSITTTPKPTKPTKPKKPYKPRIPLFLKIEHDFNKPIRKKKTKKKGKSRYSASLGGLLSRSKKKPKTITGVERRGSKDDYSKQVSNLLGL